MNISKFISFISAVGCAVSAISGTVPIVSDVTMTQPSGSHLVTITYRLKNEPAVVTLDVQTNRTDAATANESDWISIGGEAVCNAQGAVWRKVTRSDGVSVSGADGVYQYSITWRPDHSWPGHRIENNRARAVVTAWSTNNTPDYMVVDVADNAVANSQKYYPSAEFLPGGLLKNDEYRTTKLVMRKIMAKDVEWTMGSTPSEELRNSDRERTHLVKLTNNYYMGVFPVTQTQWNLFYGRRYGCKFNNVDSFSMRPVEWVCFNQIRMNKMTEAAAAAESEEWPGKPFWMSFLGLLRSKTGLDFDLPSEAQWEFAARAGNGDTKWGDGSAMLNQNSDCNLSNIGRYASNGGFINGVQASYDCGSTNGTAIVGSYRPNDWGLYDMSGNVFEICLDWYADDISSLTGRVNNVQGASTERVSRGGAWQTGATYCRPASRNSVLPTKLLDNHGFRVMCRAGLD